MSNIWAITRREVEAYFASPIAYVSIAMFILIFGATFYIYLRFFVDMGMQMTRMGSYGEHTLNVNQDLIRYVLQTSGIVVLFMMPIITMRSFAEERRSGSIELLLTSPITDWQLVMGKFFGALTLYATMLGLTLFHMGILFFYGEPEWQPVLVGYLGLLLLGSGFIAVGLLYSSLTTNQIVAAVATFSTFLILWLLEGTETLVGSWGELVSYLSVTKHMAEFTKGVIDSRDVIYYLSFTALGLFLCRQSIESYRWRG